MKSVTNTKITFNELLYKSLYYRYRAFFIPVGTIFVCVLLFWLVIIPQMQAFFAQRDALTADTQNLAVLHQNLKTITSLDSAKLDQTFTTATHALPTEKDFVGILSALNSAAVGSGVLLQDYAFQLGDLTGLDQNGKASPQLPIQLTVSVTGDTEGAKRFVKQLKAQLPLSDVISVTAGTGNSIAVAVIFYYAPLPKITFDDSVPLSVITTADGSLLDTLGQPIPGDFGTVAASRSATIAPTPTSTPTRTPTLSPSPTAVATQSAK